MTTKLLTLFTRAPLHIGCGSSVGAIDMPVLRERPTGYPVIPGSAIKGVLADLWNEKTAGGEVRRSQDGITLFGSDDNKNAAAGKLLIGEGKLIAFPIRSAKGAFAWLTCPLVLNRFKRDSGAPFDVPDVTGEQVLVTKETRLAFESQKVVFEEYPLSIEGELNEGIGAALQGLYEDTVWQEMPKHLAVVSDELFQYFCLNACEIAQHNRIDDETGVVADGALFSQENVPSEAGFYSVLNAADGALLERVSERLSKEGNLIQVGADITTGLGWCSVSLKEVK